jgi:hypothetical protein
VENELFTFPSSFDVSSADSLTSIAQRTRSETKSANKSLRSSMMTDVTSVSRALSCWRMVSDEGESGCLSYVSGSAIAAHTLADESRVTIAGEMEIEPMLGNLFQKSGPSVVASVVASAAE